MLTTLAQAFTVTLLSLFPVMNPIGNLPAFVALTAGDPAKVRHAQAYKTGLYVFGLLAVFTLAGRPLLNALGISLPALQIGGGLIVAHAAFGMVTGSQHLSAGEQQHGTEKTDVSFTPMAMPLLSGPGSLGIVVALDARSSGAGPLIGIVLGVLAMSVAAAAVLRLGEPVLERLGPTGIGALTRIFGFLILAIGVELIVHGILAVAPGLTH